MGARGKRTTFGTPCQCSCDAEWRRALRQYAVSTYIATRGGENEEREVQHLVVLFEVAGGHLGGGQLQQLPAVGGLDAPVLLLPQVPVCGTAPWPLAPCDGDTAAVSATLTSAACNRFVASIFGFHINFRMKEARGAKTMRDDVPPPPTSPPPPPPITSYMPKCHL